MRTLALQFLRDRSGATAIEYALVAGGIAVVIVAAVQLLGSNINTKYRSIASVVLAP